MVLFWGMWWDSPYIRSSLLLQRAADVVVKVYERIYIYIYIYLFLSELFNPSSLYKRASGPDVLW